MGKIPLYRPSDLSVAEKVQPQDTYSHQSFTRLADTAAGNSEKQMAE